MLRPMLMDNKISENITECVPVLVKHSRPTKLSGFGSHPQLRIILISSLTGIRKIRVCLSAINYCIIVNNLYKPGCRVI